MTFFLDLDGTLIDAKLRLFKLFNFLVEESTLSYDEYWGYKSNGISHNKLLRSIFLYSTTQIEEFQNQWMQLIEHENWLKYDTPITGVTAFLEKMVKENHTLYVVTARQKKQTTISQIHQLGWSTYFKEILVTQQKTDKISLVKPLINNNNNVFIGDTGKDVELGKTFKGNTVAVLTGFLNEETLKQYNPDIIINSIIDYR